jgi:hypothetical protein
VISTIERMRPREEQREDKVQKLQTASRFGNPDDAYALLVEARRGLSEAAAADVDAKLVLILANHVGDIDVLREAIALAKCGN